MSAAAVVVERVLAPNPGPMTLDGTNTWVLADPAAGLAVVVDPGPDDPGHLCAVVSAAERYGCRPAVVLITHRHADHTAGAAVLAGLDGVVVRAVDPVFRSGPDGLDDGDTVIAGAVRLQVVATPGHTTDSVSFLLQEGADPAILTGDTVLGRGTTVVAHPDGRLGPYLASLERLRSLAAERGVTRLLPGHGPVVEDPLGVLDGYLAHRRDRLEQVRAAVAAGATTAAEVVERVYADVDRALWPAAELSVRAQLAHLEEER